MASLWIAKLDLVRKQPQHGPYKHDEELGIDDDNFV